MSRRRWPCRTGSARGLAVNLLVFFGAMSLGALVWGQSEDRHAIVLIQSQIAPEDEEAFVAAAHGFAAERYRDGANQWELVQDVPDPALWVEIFHLPS